MNNSIKQQISQNKRKNRLISYTKCKNQLQKLIDKKTKSSFEIQQINYFHYRLTQINIQAYMEG